MKKWRVATAVCVLGLMAAADARACASCGCSLGTDWADLNASTKGGFTFDLRYDDLDQDQLRHGTGTISPVAASRIVNDGNPQEVETYTRNQYLTATLDYSSGGNWGVNVSVPYLDRDHETLGTASDGLTEGPGGGSYVSSTSDFGDIKIIGRYSGFLPRHNFGILFGLKLPTGKTGLTGTSTDPTQPAPVTIDPGLQPGTGTTDLITGAYFADSLNMDWVYYSQFLYQRAFDTVRQYRPGDSYNLSLGLKYLGFDRFTPQIQLNARYVRHDTGAAADTVSTGGTLVYLSPGVNVPVTKTVALYGFVQVPVYQGVNGVQLAPKYITSVGVRYAF